MNLEDDFKGRTVYRAERNEKPNSRLFLVAKPSVFLLYSKHQFRKQRKTIAKNIPVPSENEQQIRNHANRLQGADIFTSLHKIQVAVHQ